MARPPDSPSILRGIARGLFLLPAAPQAPPSNLPVPVEEDPPEPVIQVEISDRQIEGLALKAATRFAALPPAEAEAAWERWEAALQEELPPYAAVEVARRARELDDLAREA